MNIVVISDLHLSEGWKSSTGRISRLEDFFFDDAFERFLCWLNSEGRRLGVPWRLVIAGDMVDFLQIVEIPTDMDLKLRPSELEFGLGTSSDRTVWKLNVLMNGHDRFFRALISFLAAGNHLSVVAGNHDIEWTMPEVKRAFLEFLENKARKMGCDFLRSNVTFHTWFYFEKGTVWIEHGHQYDALNSFDFPYYPYIPQTREILLPAGSFFVRYLFNTVEQINPFADNIKPIGEYLRRYLFRLFLSRNVWKALRAFVRIVEKIRPLSGEDRKRLSALNFEGMVADALQFDISRLQLERLRSMWVPSSIYNEGVVGNLVRFFRSGGDEEYAEIAAVIADILDVKVVCFGHTHNADVRVLDRRSCYVNTGTWSRVFCHDETEKLIRSEQCFPFLSIVRNDSDRWDVRLMNWRDELGRGEELKLFAFS
ncbi:MAG: metallophosphoesterase [Syntrophales bacterium]|nr:metallophosphoesterase [Syntrophales bacterium]